ncbi:MAG: hypothetical protein ACWA49_04490, partial [Ruegeria sp.]
FLKTKVCAAPWFVFSKPSRLSIVTTAATLLRENGQIERRIFAAFRSQSIRRLLGAVKLG